MKTGAKTNGHRCDAMKASIYTGQTSVPPLPPRNLPRYINYKTKSACTSSFGYAARPQESANAETWNIRNFKVKKINILNYAIFINTS
jgi:hypothetical protein